MPKKTRMTERIYEYLQEIIPTQGYAPSVREICAAVGLKSPSTVHFHLKRLQEQGLITLPEDAGLEPTVLDIVDNPHNFKITEMEAAQLPRSLDSLDVAVVNGNYAIQAGLKMSDALAIESAEGTAGTAYVNVLTVKEGRENETAIQALAEAMKSQQVKDYITETYGGAVVAVF